MSRGSSLCWSYLTYAVATLHSINLTTFIFYQINQISFVSFSLTCWPIDFLISLIRLLVLRFDLCICLFDYSGLLFGFRILLSVFEVGFDVLGLLFPFRFSVGRFEKSIW